MICTADFNGYFTSVNPAFERILGYRESELLGRPFLEFVHPDDRERTEEEAAALAEGAQTVQFQNRYFDKDGELHWLEWTSQPALDEEVIYGVARDVTERKALEQELGHAAGDRALCEVARLLRDNLRGSDVIARDTNASVPPVQDLSPDATSPEAIVARLGGDEFVVLLPEADEQGAAAAAERVAAAVRDSRLSIDGREVRLGVSVGVALFDEYGRPGERELLAAADRAMYRAKAAGGGGATVAASPA